MRKLSSEAEKVMMERFGKDTIIALATVEHEVPYVRNEMLIMRMVHFILLHMRFLTR